MFIKRIGDFFHDPKRRDFNIGLTAWFVANLLMAVAVWFGSPLLQPIFQSLLNGRDLPSNYALSLLSSIQLLVNVVTLVFLAYARRPMALGALVGLAPTLTITLCFGLLIPSACSNQPLAPYLQSSGPPTTGLRIVYDNRFYNMLVSQWDLFVIRSDGGDKTRLTYHGGSEPIWSPDGRKIAFRGEDGAIRVINADGTGLTRLANGSQYAWSSDGRRIVFVSPYQASTGLFPISIIDSNGQNRKSFSVDGSGPVWSPSGEQIIFYRSDNRIPASYNIFVINSDGTGLKRLTDGLRPIWSPDGRQIAFTRQDRGVVIYLMNTNGGEQQLLANGGGPIWSPDGRQIAFVGQDAIVVINADGSGQRPVTKEGCGPGDCHLSWSPDGKQIAFQRFFRIYIVNVDANGERELAVGTNPAWAPR